MTRVAWVRRVTTGLQPPRPHLDRLLRDIVEARVLERREKIVDVGGIFLRPRALPNASVAPLRRERGDRGGEFAVAPVEDEHARAGPEAQHVDEIMRLIGRQRARSAPSARAPATIEARGS